MNQNYYVGEYELDFINGSFIFPEEYIHTWKERNKTNPIKFYGKYDFYEGENGTSQKYKHIALYDPLIYAEGITSGGFNLNDFVDFNPTFSSPKNKWKNDKNGEETLELIAKKSLILPESKNISLPNNIRDLLDLQEKIYIVGNEDYLELWKNETWHKFKGERKKPESKYIDMYSQIALGIR